jgi:hypothetical protein
MSVYRDLGVSADKVPGTNVVRAEPIGGFVRASIMGSSHGRWSRYPGAPCRAGRAPAAGPLGLWGYNSLAVCLVPVCGLRRRVREPCSSVAGQLAAGCRSRQSRDRSTCPRARACR